MTVYFDASAEEVPAECFVATSFTFGPCPCGCGNFKLVGFDAQGVARALFAIEPGQVAAMAAMLCLCAPQAPNGQETKH